MWSVLTLCGLFILCCLCRRKSILKGSTSTVNLDASHTSPLSVHSISESAVQLHNNTVANTFNNMRLPVSPLPSGGSTDTSGHPNVTQLIPDIISTSTSTSSLLPSNYSCTTSSVSSCINNITTATAPSSLSSSYVSLFSVPTTSISREYTTHEGPTDALRQSQHVMSTVTKTISVPSSPFSSTAPSAYKGSSLSSNHSSCVTFSDDSLSTNTGRVSPLLVSRPLAPNTPRRLLPPPIFEETSPPALPLTTRFMPSFAQESTFAISGGAKSPSPMNPAEKRSSSAITKTSSSSSISSNKKTSSMQRQSATKNLIACASDESPPSSVQSSSVQSSSIAMTMPSTLIHNDAPLPANINRPGSRSAIYSTENFSLTPEPKGKCNYLSVPPVVKIVPLNLNTTIDVPYSTLKPIVDIIPGEASSQDQSKAAVNTTYEEEEVEDHFQDASEGTTNARDYNDKQCLNATYSGSNISSNSGNTPCLLVATNTNANNEMDTLKKFSNTNAAQELDRFLSSQESATNVPSDINSTFCVDHVDSLSKYRQNYVTSIISL